MKYYIMKQNKIYTDVPRIINWFGRINTEHVAKLEYNKLQDMYGFLVEENNEMYQTDAIFEPVFIVSKMVKYCLENYEPNIGYTFVGLIEKKNNRTYEFFLPHLVEMECLSSRSVITGNRTILEKPVFDMKKIDRSKFVFKIAGLNSTYIAAREEFVESILRRDAKGMQFVEVELEE